MSERHPMSTAERVTFTVAIGILVVLAGSIVWLWAQPREPAIVTVAPSGDRRVTDSQTYVTARVRNSGDDTARAVQVRAELTVDGKVVAEGEQTIDFLSGGESEQVVFVFDVTDPDALVDLRVGGYVVP